MNLSYDPNASGGNFKNAPAGLHNARICWIIDMGTQNEPGFNGAPPKNVKRLKWFFELVDTNEVFDPNKGPQPFFLSKKYTKSLAGNSNNLRKDIVSLLGRPIAAGEALSLRQFLNMPCMIQVLHEQSKSDATKIYPKIIAVMPAQNPAAVRPLRNPAVFFDMEDPSCVQEYAKINGRKLLEDINRSPEFGEVCRRSGLQPRVIAPYQQQAGGQGQAQPQQQQQQYQHPPVQQQQAWGNPPAPVQQQQPPAQQQAWNGGGPNWNQQAQNFQQQPPAPVTPYVPVQQPVQQPAWGVNPVVPPVNNQPPVQQPNWNTSPPNDDIPF